MKVFRFLLGLAIGAGVALLFAPKSGRELRRQLFGGAGGGCWRRHRRGTSSRSPSRVGRHGHRRRSAGSWKSRSEPEVVVEEVVVIEEAAGEEAPTVPVWDEPAVTPVNEDLGAGIDETRAALENELAQPFADETAELADEAAARPTTRSSMPAAAELVAEAVVEAVAAELVAEEAIAEAEAAT